VETIREPLLYRANRAAWERVAAEAEWRRAIVLAREAGHSLRQIADAAGVSHVRVHQLLRQQAEGSPNEPGP
jgi:DNA-directed RNA polymerase specialized sigma24 family protein